ncbi:MAG: insulinase family protein [Deltaproteobacteria bacterium]|nr:insulinase family protein [Deltaproteobacteria bacterium]
MKIGSPGHAVPRELVALNESALPRPPSATDFAVVDDPVLGHVERFHLSNGIPVTIVPRSGSPTVTILATVNTGTLDEAEGSYGVAHYLEHVVHEKTADFPDKGSLAEFVQARGASTNACTSRERTAYHIQLPAESAEDGLYGVQQLLFHALITPDVVNLHRGIILSEAGDYRVDGKQQLLADIFGQPSLCRAICGSNEDLHRVTVDSLESFRSAYYTPSNISLVVVGKISPDFPTLIERYFGGYPDTSNAHQRQFNEAKVQIPADARFDLWGSSHSRISFIFPTPIGSIADMHSSKVLQLILHGDTDRSFNAILRERLGIAYNASATMERLRSYSWIDLRTELPVEASGVGISTVRSAVQDFLRRPFTEEDKLEAVKRLKFQLLHEAADPLQAAFQTSALQLTVPHLGRPGRLLDSLSNVTIDSIHNTAMQVLDDSNMFLFINGGLDNALLKKVYLNGTIEQENRGSATRLN